MGIGKSQLLLIVCLSTEVDEKNRTLLEEVTQAPTSTFFMFDAIVVNHSTSPVLLSSFLILSMTMIEPYIC